MNHGVRQSSGEYVVLLNPDCVLHADPFRPLASWLDEHPRVGAAGALVVNPDGSVQASARRFPGVTTLVAGRSSWLTRAWPDNPWTRRNLVRHRQNAGAVEVDWVSGACMMIRRSAFAAVGGFDEGFFLYWEDADFCCRLKRAGWLTVYHPGAAVTHLAGRSSVTDQRRSIVAFHRSAYRYAIKNGGWIARAAAPIVFAVIYARLVLQLGMLAVRRRRERARTPW